MARPAPSEKPTVVTVERGDTLSKIARDYLGDLMAYKKLAAINNIKNPDLIYVGQKIKLTSDGGSSPDSGSSSDSNKAKIEQFGYQSDSNGVVFATWSWDKSNTENYKAEWSYHTGDGVWFIGSDSTTEYKQSTYNVPSNATKIRFRVKPISKKYTSNNKETSYWTAEWSSYKTCEVDDITPPAVPPTPNVTIEKYKLTAELDNLDVNATKIQFKIVKNNSTTFKTGTVSIKTGHASYSCNVDAGGEYKVACRSYNGSDYSDWSDYSDNVTTIPTAPKGITTCKATSRTSVYLEWSKVTGAETYNIEYTTKKQYFDGSDQVTPISGITGTHYEKTGLESGQEYFFRVQAANEQGTSGWSEPVSIILGKEPAAPTTWSSTTTAVNGEPVTLYWVHNAEDGSSQTAATVEITIKDKTIEIVVENTTDEDEKDKISSCIIDTQNDRISWTDPDGATVSQALPADMKISDGTNIKWRVKTKGILNTYGVYSMYRTIDVYAPTTLSLSLLSQNVEIDTVESFPFYIHALPSNSSNQIPISYHLSVVSNENYETVDRVGNTMLVIAGQEVYSKHFDITDKLEVMLSAGDIDLENGVEYAINCTVAMNSGLSTEASLPFTVSWTDVAYTPNAEISLDKETYVTHISPFCRSYNLVNYEVTKSGTRYVKTTRVVGQVYGETTRYITTTGEDVYTGTTVDGDDIYYCQVEESKVIPGVSLSVYRREFDGGFTELATALDSTKSTFITDPHPALDYARYRIVATTDATGAVSYCDLPGYPVGGTAAIIQWNEAWSNFDVTGEDALEEPAWAGSMLKLPYNIDVSDTNSPDVELVEYIGREHPVGYYGTQRGHTSTWNVEIVADDEETLYAIRRLQNWMGDAYVREPSGSGYWANVKVSFSQKHRELTIPVTFTITRVEGGV